MKLSEIFEYLASGELSQIKLGGQPLSQLQPEHVKQMLTHVNLGLNDLYKKFLISRGELTLKLEKGVYVYKLDTAKSIAKAYKDADDWIAQNPNQPVPIIDERLYYIKDRDYPFKGDINKIEQLVLDSGYILGINDGNRLSAKNNTTLELIIPKMLVDQTDVPGPTYATEYVQVHYRTKPPKFTRGDEVYYEPCQIEIPLPDVYLLALCYFIAGRILTPIGSMDEYKPGDNYTAKYQQECQQLMSLGFELSGTDSPVTLRDRGFV